MLRDAVKPTVAPFAIDSMESVRIRRRIVLHAMVFGF